MQVTVFLFLDINAFAFFLQEEDPNRNKKKPLGHTNHFCPVALKDNIVLHPGNPEVAAKFREKVYYFSTSEARDKFLANPDDYIPKDGPPKVSCFFFISCILYLLRFDLMLDLNNLSHERNILRCAM